MRTNFQFIVTVAVFLLAGAALLVSPAAWAQDDGSEAQGGAVHAGYLSVFNILPYRSGQPPGALL